MFKIRSDIDLRKIGILVVAGSIALAVISPFLYHQVSGLLELYFSRDHKITAEGMRELAFTYYFGVALLLSGGVSLLKLRDESWRIRMKQAFLLEPLFPYATIKPSPKFTLIVSSLSGLLLIVSMRLTPKFPAIYNFLYAKDHGVLDLFVPTAMTIAAILLGVTVWKLREGHNPIKSRSILMLVYLLMAGLFFVYAGEETSWGQDFFGWQTPSMFSGNLEGQTNLHNYFNPYFDYGYIALSVVLVIVLISLWLEFGQKWLPYGRLFLPHPSLTGLGLLIAFVALVWYREQELLEEMRQFLSCFIACEYSHVFVQGIWRLRCKPRKKGPSIFF